LRVMHSSAETTATPEKTQKRVVRTGYCPLGSLGSQSVETSCV
jgi:hypothetical protein